MANWGYAVTQAVAGGAQSAVGSIDTQLKATADQQAADRELDMKTRLLAVQESMAQRAEERKRAQALQQGQAVSAGATGLLNTAAASSIDASLGSHIDPSNPDSAASLAAIRANPEAMKAYGLPQETDLTKAKARAEAARNTGDVAAAGEEDKNVRNLVTDARNVDQDASTNKRLDNLQVFQEAQAKRQDMLAQATLNYQKTMLEKTDTRAQEAAAREQRQATASALKGVTDVIKDLQKEKTAMDVTPEKAKVLDSQMQSAQAEAAQYRRALAGSGLPDVAAPATPPETPTAATNAKLLSDPTLAPAYIKRFGQDAYDAATKKAPATPATPAAAASTPPAQPGLLASEAPYTPPPDSPAAQMAARAATARQAREQSQQDALASTQRLVQAALDSRDPAAARAAQAAPSFNLLPQDIQTKIFAISNSRGR